VCLCFCLVVLVVIHGVRAKIKICALPQKFGKLCNFKFACEGAVWQMNAKINAETSFLKKGN
jgi:hypothetical protein